MTFDQVNIRGAEVEVVEDAALLADCPQRVVDRNRTPSAVRLHHDRVRGRALRIEGDGPAVYVPTGWRGVECRLEGSANVPATAAYRDGSELVARRCYIIGTTTAGCRRGRCWCSAR